MSVLIKDMEKPKSCFEIIDGDFEYCPFVNTDDDCVLLLKKGICNVTWGEQYGKCPLVEVTEPCEDAVSRLAALDSIKKCTDIYVTNLPPMMDKSEAYKAISKLPSVTPKRKIGRWIEEQRGIKVTLYKCSECGRTVMDDTGYDVAKDYPFCHCGAEMNGSE